MSEDRNCILSLKIKGDWINITYKHLTKKEAIEEAKIRAPSRVIKVRHYFKPTKIIRGLVRDISMVEHKVVKEFLK